MKKKIPSVITGTLYLGFVTIVTRFMGFIYKIWLGNLIGAEEMGVYQLTFPVFTVLLAICAGPFQTAVSKFTAEYKELQPLKSRQYLKASCRCSFILAVGCCIFLLLFHEPISVYFLLNERCKDLLPYIAFTIPLSAIHSCITGWYYGQKKTHVPAISNLMEQSARMLFVFLLSCFFSFTIRQVALALLIGELAGAFFSVCAIWKDLHFGSDDYSDPDIHCRSKQYGKYAEEKLVSHPYHDIFRLIWPLTANRLTMNLLQSVESVMIPSRLILYGLSESTALSSYGALTGMAMSFIMFPTALTGSFSLLLLPDIAKAQAEHRDTYIQKATRLSLQSTIFIGCIFTAVFFLWGELLGNLCFPGTMAGIYIRSLSWLCPFLFFNQISVTILHGLGLTTITFKNQLSGLILRLGITVFLVPLYGIRAYFLALLLSQILMCIFNIHYLKNNL